MILQWQPRRYTANSISIFCTFLQAFERASGYPTLFKEVSPRYPLYFFASNITEFIRRSHHWQLDQVTKRDVFHLCNMLTSPHGKARPAIRKLSACRYLLPAFQSHWPFCKHCSGAKRDASVAARRCLSYPSFFSTLEFACRYFYRPLYLLCQ